VIDDYADCETALTHYTFFAALGLAGGFLLTLWLWHRAGERLETAVLLLCAASPLVLLGGKLAYLIESGRLSAREAWFDAGYSLYGSLLLVIAFWAVVRWARPYPMLRFFDCVTPGAAIGLICGRIGCFLHGCCAGIPTSLPWGVTYPPGSMAYAAQLKDSWITESAKQSVPVHPTQLYEMGFGVLSLVLLLWLFRKRTRDGQIFLTGALWYGVFRFSIEPLRLRAEGWRPFEHLSLAQAISLALAIAALIGLRLLGTRSARA
jgi:phosphatidylglycerol:prolipoprotein diacylglycerol transferase